MRLFALQLVFRGLNGLFRAFFVNRKGTGYSPLLSVTAYATLPLFAFLIALAGRPKWLWISYLFTELILFSLNLLYYRSRMEKGPEGKAG